MMNVYNLNDYQKVLWKLLAASFSEQEAVVNLGFTSGRNYIGIFEKQSGIQVKRIREKTRKAIGRGYYRYVLANKEDKQKAVEFWQMKAKATKRPWQPLTEEQIRFVLGGDKCNKLT